MAGQQRVLRDMGKLQRQGVPPAAGLPTMSDRTARHLPGRMRADATEVMLLHGTKPDSLLAILTNGLNERFSGGLFGHGSYLAEDAGKNDQYVTVDEQYVIGSELHKRLYAHRSTPHPGKVYYLIVCRVSLGQPVRTRDSTRIDPPSVGRSVFAGSSQRELATVEGNAGPVTPPIHHHSLIAEVGGKIARFREFIVFHSEYIYPEYVLAYQRYSGQRGPV